MREAPSATRPGNLLVRWLGVAAFVVPLIAYLPTVAPSLLNDDPGEYQMILASLGVAHPTGYPLYTLLGHLFTRIVPLGDMAFRINLFSALCAAATVAVLFRLLVALDVAVWLAWLGAMGFALSGDMWRYATVAQTYTLNLLLMAAALWAFIEFQRGGRPRALIVLGFLLGCGIAHHSTFWLFLPAVGLGLMVAWQAVRRVPPRMVAPALAAFVLPLLSYLYIPLRGEQLLAQGGETLGIPDAVVNGMLTPHYLAGWTNVVAGSFYAGSTLAGVSMDWGRALGDYLATLNNQFHGFELLALALLSAPLWKHNAGLTVALLAGWVINVLVVARGVAAFNEPAGGLYTPTYLFAAIALVWTLDVVGRRSNRLSGVALGLLVMLAVGNLVSNGLPHYAASLAPTAVISVRVTAQSQLTAPEVEPQAVMLGAWSQVTPLHYLQVVEGVRSDVAVLQAPLLSPAGREFMLRTLDAGRPLILIDSDDTLIPIPMRKLPALEATGNATFAGQLTLLGYRRADRTLELYWRAERGPSADYTVFVHPITADGRELDGRDQPVGSAYFPSSLWRAGQVFRDRHSVPVDTTVTTFEIGLYDAATQKRLALPDGQTSVRIAGP